MNNKRIALLNVDKSRDLWGTINLKFELEKKGNIVKIFPYEGADIFSRIEEFFPHVLVVTTVIGTRWDDFSKYLKKYGTKIVELKAEGITVSYNEKFRTNAFVDSSFLDAELCWGEKLKKAIIKNSNISKEKVLISGHPRFDIYKKRPFNLSKKEFCKKYNLNEKKKIITFATSFPHADLTEKEKKEIDKLHKGKDIFNISKNFAITRKKFFKSVLKLAKNFPEINILVKIHPAENKEFYTKRIEKETKNVLALREEKINNVLNVTEIYIHSNSTSSIESWFIDINLPVINFYLNEYKSDALLIDAVEGQDFIKDYNQLEKKIRKYLDGEKIDKKKLEFRKQFIKDNFFKADGNSGKRAAKIINKLASESKLKNKTKKGFLNNYDKIKLIIRKLLKIPDHRSLILLREHQGYIKRVATEDDIKKAEEDFKIKIKSNK